MKYNDLIAHFMGGEIIKEEKYTMPHGSCSEGTIYTWKTPIGTPSNAELSARIGLFHYHNDWNCLIPVIEYIESLEIDEENFRFVSYKNICEIEAQCTFFQPSDMWHVHLIAEGKDKIEATYMAVVAFIKWINNEQRMVTVF